MAPSRRRRRRLLLKLSWTEEPKPTAELELEVAKIGAQLSKLETTAEQELAIVLLARLLCEARDWD